MTWLLLFACTSDTTGDSDSAEDSGTASASLTGTLVATPDLAMVTRAELTATVEPASSMVLTCEGAGEYQVPEVHRFTFESSSTTHTVMLEGLLAETEYTCSVEDQPLVLPVSFTTGSLPEDLAVHQLSLTAWEPSAQWGWTLINPYTIESMTSHIDAYAVVLDMEARVRWYYATESEGTVAFDFNADADAFWLGGGRNNVLEPLVLERDAGVRHKTSSQADHDVDWVGEDAWSLVDSRSGTCIERRSWADDTLLGSLCMEDLGLSGLQRNSLDVHPVSDGHVIYTGSGTSDMILKIHFERAEVLWTFGPGHDFPDVESDYNHDVNAFDCEGYDVCLSFYDNGTATEVNTSVQVYGLDESELVATPLRSWTVIQAVCRT